MNSPRIACLAISTLALHLVGCGSAAVPDAAVAQRVIPEVTSPSTLPPQHLPESQLAPNSPGHSPGHSPESEVSSGPSTSATNESHLEPASDVVSEGANGQDQAVRNAELVGVWKWIGNRNSGSVNHGQYRHNLLTFYPDGRCTRHTEWNRGFFEGQYRIMRAEGSWRRVADDIEVIYQGVATKDHTRVIDQFPDDAIVVPGGVESQFTDKQYTFQQNGSRLLVRNDGNLFRRISSDPEADPETIVDHEENRMRAMVEQIYSPKYGY